jgi:CRISPR-associated protein Cmr4
MATQFNAYFIQCVTNMHVGSGDTSYGIIDKMVQRDTVTGYPTIHASSLKGALREHFEKKWNSDLRVKAIFGKEGEDGSDSETGDYVFLSADLIALPIRCTHQQYVLGFDKTIADMINAKAKHIVGKEIFSCKVNGAQNNFFAENAPAEIYAEDYSLKANAYASPLNTQENLLANKYATLKNEDFATLAKNLPVVARNKVKGNKNLWYEEIVPHQTLFLTFIGTSKENSDFTTALTTDLIQIGANASVGYGLCKFIPVTFNENPA